MKKPLRYFHYNKGVLLIEWPQSQDLDTLFAIQGIDKMLSDQYPQEIYETVPGYHSLMVYYNHTQLSLTDIRSFISDTVVPSNYKVESRNWNIPVDYSRDHGIDLATLSLELDLPVDEIISLHSSTIYTVHFIGFLPGFIYLSGLSDRLHVPRRSNPRLQIPKGSVAIAAGQTGIYPVDSPGGWHIIGHTTDVLFDPYSAPPSRFMSGDTVKFQNIAKS